MSAVPAGSFRDPVASGSIANGVQSSPSPMTGQLPAHHIDAHHYQASNGLAPIEPIPLGPLCHHYALRYEREADASLQMILQDHKAGNSKGKATESPATQEYARFLFLALDLLRKATVQRRVSIQEQAFMAIDFGRIGLKLSRASSGGDSEALTHEVASVLNKAQQSVKKSSALAPVRRALTLLQVEVMLVQGDEKRAIKLLKTCKDGQADQYDSVYMYKLSFKLAHVYITSHTPNTRAAMSELEHLASLAEERGDPKIVQLAAIARLRLVCANNLWSEVDGCITACTKAIGFMDPEDMPPPESAIPSSRVPSDTASPAPTPTATAQGSLDEVKTEPSQVSAPMDAWDLNIRIHYLCLRAVWESRVGAAKRSKALLEAIFVIGDGLSDVKESSGVHEIIIKPRLDYAEHGSLHVQLTPPSVLETLIYFAACVSRRDTIGKKEHCKRLRCAQLAIERLSPGKTGAWDMQLEGFYDLAQVNNMACNLHDLQAGVLIELATTSLLRNAHQDAIQVFQELVQLLRAHDLISEYGPRLLLLQAQLAHSLNLTSRARQSYRASYGLANPGSDLELVARLNEMCMLLGNRRGIASLGLESALTALVEQCNSSNEVGIRTASMLLAALLSDGVQQTKKGMSRVLAICNQAELQVVRQIAFAISAPLYAHTQPLQSIKLLESALTLSQHHGGREREDGVGHAALGSFVGRELGILYARTGRSKDKIRMMQDIVKSHRRRYDELAAAGPALLGVDAVKAEVDEPKSLKVRLKVVADATAAQAKEQETKRDRTAAGEDGTEPATQDGPTPKRLKLTLKR